ncbi:MAG: hypothetical protein Tsb0021_17950 [Chlamydiales bacterium]
MAYFSYVQKELAELQTAGQTNPHLHMRKSTTLRIMRICDPITNLDKILKNPPRSIFLQEHHKIYLSIELPKKERV